MNNKTNKPWRIHKGDMGCPNGLISISRGNRFSGDRDFELKRIKPEELPKYIKEEGN